jgi:hypothetical protein
MADDLASEVERALEGLRAVLAALDAGELEGSAVMRAGLVGGISALESVHNTDV